MGLANTDNGFTGTVFAPFDGEFGLDHLKSGADGMRYFEKYFQRCYPAHSRFGGTMGIKPYISSWRVFVVNLTIGAYQHYAHR
jgi:hypothetical protein